MKLPDILFILITETPPIIDKITNNPKVLVFGILLIILTIVILFILKNVIVNSIVGVLGLLVCNGLLGFKLPYLITLIVTAIFGVAGLGVMVIFKYFGIV